MASLTEELLDSLPRTLKSRVYHRNNNSAGEVVGNKETEKATFALYIPTVVLRKEHNPGFALACHLANKHQIPLLVFALVLDDAHLPTDGLTSMKRATDSSTKEESLKHNDTKPAIVFTARRTAFVLEALQTASSEWADHGAGVAIRVHGPGCRTPHHLTLARQATVVVTDEPFIHPYRRLVESLERACGRHVPLYTVDGSTTVPPCSHLVRQRSVDGIIQYANVPDKAWKWEDRTKAARRSHVLGAVFQNELDAPELICRLNADFFLTTTTPTKSTVSDIPNDPLNNGKKIEALKRILPREWQDPTTPSPGKRPWTVTELQEIENLRNWVQSWPGVDQSVPCCSQTHGAGGKARWERFANSTALSAYAQRRNDIKQPHAVSRMSCYLNYGTVSIFRIVQSVWAKSSESSSSYSKKGPSKFLDEVVKWREIGYVHCFASRDYHRATSVPHWATQWLTRERVQQHHTGRPSYSLNSLETGTTESDTWNAMQRYLVDTGELHNNARMTWGKTIVHWQRHGCTLEMMLSQLVYLNDRYALDGLSPPSYAGLLWCLGWCDKPDRSGGIAEKLASRYRTGSDGFAQAQEALLLSTTTTLSKIAKRKQSVTSSSQHAGTALPTTSPSTSTQSKRQKSIVSYFRVTG